MASNKDFLRTNVGFSDTRINYLSGTGVPGDTVVTNESPKGSRYTDITTGLEYRKISQGTGSDKWEQNPTKEDVDSLISGVSWREPVVVVDLVSTTIAEAISSMETDGGLDGVTLEDGDRILLTQLSAETNNVYIVGIDGASFTLTEDPENVVSVGDTVYVEDGAEASSRYSYNGAQWIPTDRQSRDELNYIRTFLGKDAKGSETPTYNTNNHVANGDSLELGIGKIDTALGAKVTTGAVRTKGAITDASVGTNILALDTAIGADMPSTNLVDNSKSLSQNLSAVDAYVGSKVSDGEYIRNANTVGQNLSALDNALNDQITHYGTDNVTSKQVIGNFSVASTTSAKWMVEITSASDVSRKKIIEYNVFHNGNTITAATDVSSVVVSEMSVGAAFSGLTVQFEIQGTDAAEQTIDLSVTASAAVNVKAVRIKV